MVDLHSPFLAKQLILLKRVTYLMVLTLMEANVCLSPLCAYKEISKTPSFYFMK